MFPKPTVADMLAAAAAQSPEAIAARQDAQYKQLQTQQLSNIEQSIHAATLQIMQFLDGKVTKTEVVNQLQEIGTPDALKVVEAINSLHGTLKTHENTDLTEITTVMRQVLDEARKIPKTTPTIPQTVIPDNSKQFASLTTAINSIESAIKAQKLDVPAPIVNVPAATVNVDAPDLNPLREELRTVAEAVRAIVIPEYKPTDNSTVEKLLKSVDARLKDLPEQMPSSRGGGGGGIAAYRGTDGNVVQVTLDANGAVPVSDVPLGVQLDDTTTANTTYIGKAPIGSATSSPVWQIAKLDTTSGLVKTWADGDARFNNIFDNRASLSYS